MEPGSFSFYFSSLLILVAVWPFGSPSVGTGISIEEATLKDLQLAFNQNQLTSRQLVEFYIEQISRYNKTLQGVIEVNPEALELADKADGERKASKKPKALPVLHGIPVLVKDNIATKDKLNTTAGSFALLGSVVARDAGIVAKLRKAGAIILGKASLSQWSGFRSSRAPAGWNSRTGQGSEPYTLGDPCGSSSGSAISVSANMAAVAIGTETDGSVLCPSGYNSVVGIKPTVGLTSRAGVVPISRRQDTVGTVSDAAYVLDAIVGYDVFDQATYCCSHYIPSGGYGQFLKADGLRGKRLGIVEDFSVGADSSSVQAFEELLTILRGRGAILVNNLKINNFEVIQNVEESGELMALSNEFRVSLNGYLEELVSSPIRSLSDLIEFNKNHAELEKMKDYGQDLLEMASTTTGAGMGAVLSNLTKLSKEGFEKTMIENKLDAIVAPNEGISTFLAIGGFPGITVPAGYRATGKPFGIYFGGLKGFEPRLIEIAYGFEQATKRRKPPPLSKLDRSAYGRQGFLTEDFMNSTIFRGGMKI